MTTTGKIAAVNGNMITVVFDGAVAQNEVGYAVCGDKRLMAEIVRVRGTRCDMQVFDATSDLMVDDKVEFTGEMLAAELGPGLLAQVYDGLQNPLAELAEEAGKISRDAAYFLQRGMYLPGLPRDIKWDWHPTAEIGSRVMAGDFLGWVPEGIFDGEKLPGHKIMVPFSFRGVYTVKSLAPAGAYTVTETIAVLEPVAGESSSAQNAQSVEVQMLQRWPVKVPIKCFSERLAPEETLETTVRTIDTFFPVAVGGTYCVPGPFGAGKTVLQQTTARYAKVDVVISAACGERAGEVVETLKEFPEIVDPKTGQSLMKRTIIICNTSSMPVASREASVYTAVTLAEYFRQMGLDVLVLADSTSRWAQAMRELSGRLEEIPGEEAFPAYLESRIAAFYERAGRVRLRDGSTGSVTIGGTVSPAGGNFDEPVTQATLKVVGGFHGLSRARSDARRYPAIDPLDSWSHYAPVIERARVEAARSILRKGNEVGQMMKVVGEEGTSQEDFVTYLKAEFIDAVYLQQNAFSDSDATTPVERQRIMFSVMEKALVAAFAFADKVEARHFFMDLRQSFIDWNDKPFNSDEFAAGKATLEEKIASATK
ncbi:MAG: V-type ATP synthase subunit A [Kiritimatiellae bacterium]|jgi:V/A-type H+-transporting ATPase subunit A|nr:V-type ATP synthase subunit A [Kiritimatiellia bacterium]